VVGSNDKPFIKDANGNPVAANPVMAGANEDDAAFSITTAQLLANTGDYEGDTLTVSNLTLQSTNDNGQPNNDGVTIINGNSLSVNPSAYDYLADGESEVIEYRYTVSDGFASSNVIQTVKITITGSNDGATISVGQGDSAFEIVQEDDPNALNANDELEVQGTLSISDPDRGESLFQSGAATFDPNTSTNNTALGSLTITEGGEWTYAIDNDQLAVQELGANDTFTETFTVTSQDGSDSQSISVQVTGANDEATIVDSNDVAVTQPVTIAVTEDDNLTTLETSVVLAVDDVDLNEDQFLSSTATPDGQTVGAMAFVNGAWTYTVANAAIESLGSGAVTDNTGTTITNGSLTESFTVTSLDETDDATIEVTVNGNQRCCRHCR
jgi:VCBS repeat-containing protein